MNIVGIIVGPSLLFIWLIINIIYLFRKLKNKVKEKNKNTKIIVKCEKCSNERETTIDEFFATNMRKTKSINMSANVGPVGVGITHYNYYAKNFYCPICNKKTWSEIKNYNEMAKENMKLMLPIIIKHIGIIILGGIIIVFIMNVLI